MSPASRWVRFVSKLLPHDLRDDWVEEWDGELAASGGGTRHAWGALADAWYLRTEGWTMDGTVRDLRTAARALRRKPGFTAIAALTLAIGIGANTAIFSVVDGVLINPLPFPGADRIVSYNHEAPGLGVNVPVIPHSQAMYVHYLETARQLDAFAVFQNTDVNLITDGEPQQLSSLDVTVQFFDVIGVQPFLGRGFVEGEDRPGADPVAVLSYSLWEQNFGSDRSVLGRSVEMDGVRRTIVGVMPPDAAVWSEELFVPMTIDAEPDAGSLGLIGVARLSEGATLESANVEMQDLLVRYAEANADDLPANVLENAGLAAVVKPLKEIFVEDLREALWVLLGTVGFVLLIACANVANLFLVRAEARQREQAVRTAMGASKWDVMRQYLTESILLALVSGVLGLGLAFFGVQGLLALAPAELPQALDIGIDGSVLLFTAAISVATGCLFGLFPVLGYGRREVSRSLRDGGRSATVGRDRHRVRSGLVISQVALALVLLVGSGLSLRSFVALRSVDLGFETEGMLTFRFALPTADYESAARTLDFHRRLVEQLETIPGATSVGMVSGLPLTDAKSATPMEPVDRPFSEDELAPLVETREATPGYFATMGIELLDGRELEWADQGNDFRGVVVSRALADGFWPGRSAVGQSIRSQGDSLAWQVVGVAEDVRFDGVAEEPLPMIYRPVIAGNATEPNVVRSMDAVVRVSGAPLDVVGSANDALRAVDPRVPMINPRTVETIVDESLVSTSFTVTLLGIAAGIALLLGTVGIYGVISYIVSRRTQEIGVRIALGAPSAQVLRGVVGQGMRLTAIGVVLGLVGALGLSRALESLLYGVPRTDPITFGTTAALLTAVALLASWIPARRAARIDPVEALRAD